MKRQDVKNLGKDELCDLINSIDGVVFTDPYLLNLVAIRDLDCPDEWNDFLIYFYWDSDGVFHKTVVDQFTTDPGLKYLKDPCSPSGCAIVKEGWYRKLWIIGKHKGYEALQQYSPITVYRDANKDGKFDLDPNNTETGMFGINLHRANVNSYAPKIGAWSAGCQVIRCIEDWKEFLKTCKICRDYGGQKYFSLALFNINNI